MTVKVKGAALLALDFTSEDAVALADVSDALRWFHLRGLDEPSALLLTERQLKRLHWEAAEHPFAVKIEAIYGVPVRVVE